MSREAVEKDLRAISKKDARCIMTREDLAEDLLDLYTLRDPEPHAVSFEACLKGRK